MEAKLRHTMCENLMINGIFPVTLVEKGCHSHQRLQPPPDGELVNPEGTQEAKEHLPTCCLAAIRLQPLPAVSPEETQDVKTQDTGPR